MTQFVLERITPPAVEPVTLAQMIRHVREFSSLSDAAEAELTALIVTAREWVEEYAGRALVEQTWKLTIDRRIGNGPFRYLTPPPGYPENGYGWMGWETGRNLAAWVLPRSPVIAITSFDSLDSNNVATPIDPTAYLLQNPASKWPTVAGAGGSAISGSRFAITYRAGYAPGIGSPDPTPDITQVPAVFAQAIQLYAGALYDRDKEMMQKLMDAAMAVVKGERAELDMA